MQVRFNQIFTNGITLMLVYIKNQKHHTYYTTPSQCELFKFSAKQQQGHIHQESSYDCEESFTGEQAEYPPYQHDGCMSCIQ